jgi:hypothetical protein
MADGVFLRRVDLAESLLAMLRLEHRVVAEAVRAARRPHPMAGRAPLEGLDMPVRPGQDEGAGEPGRPVLELLRGVHHLPHGIGIVARPVGLDGPIGRADARRAIQRRDREARIIGQRRQARGPRGGERLDGGIADERGLGLVGFRQVQFAGRDRPDAMGGEQRRDFAQLALVVGGDDDALARGESPVGHGAKVGGENSPDPPPFSVCWGLTGADGAN